MRTLYSNGKKRTMKEFFHLMKVFGKNFYRKNPLIITFFVADERNERNFSILRGNEKNEIYKVYI